MLGCLKNPCENTWTSIRRHHPASLPKPESKFTSGDHKMSLPPPPSYLQNYNRSGAVQGMTAGLGISRPAHVSLRGGKFRLVSATGVEILVPTHHLDCIIIGAQFNASRLYYGQVYDENNPGPPVCFSDNGTGPSVNSLEPQAPTCAVCRWNERGSDTTFTGKPTTACTKKKKLAVLIPGDPHPGLNVYELQVPIASLSVLRQYSDWAAQQAVPGWNRPCSVGDFITRLGWDAQKNFRLTLDAVGWVDERAMELVAYIDQQKLMDVPLGNLDVAMNPEKAALTIQAREGQGLAVSTPAAQAPPQQFHLPPRPSPQQTADPAWPAAQPSP